MLSIESYITLLKKYANNPSKSMEDFARSFLDTYVKAGNILNKKGYPYDFDKTRISRLLNHIDDVPSAFRDAIDDETLRKNITKQFPQTLENELNLMKKSQIVQDMRMLISLDEYLSEEEKGELLNNRLEFKAFLLLTFLKTITINNKQAKAKENVLISRGKYTVEFVKGDLFKYAYDSRSKKKRIIVIPTDTTFKTNLSSRLSGAQKSAVSEETIHGQFISRLIKLGYKEKEIKDMIYSDLDSKNMEYKVFDDEREYPIGTVATLDFDNKVFFLLAIAKFDKSNITRSNVGNIESAINLLVDYYDRYGQGYRIFLPLLGTGRSRANLTISESYKTITDVLLQRMRDVHGNVVIVALPDAYNEIRKGNDS